MTKGPAFVDEFEVVEARERPTAFGVNRKLYWQVAPGATPPAQFCPALN